MYIDKNRKIFGLYRNAMLIIIGSKEQLQSPKLNKFSMMLGSNKIEFVNKAKYLGLLAKDDMSWDENILQLCKAMNY